MTFTIAEARSDAQTLTRRKQIARRHIEHVRAHTTDTHPDANRFIPAHEYLDPDLVTAERALLRMVPLVAAHSSQLPGPGSFRTEELMDVPLLLVRQDDGAVKAFLNSCSHRGSRVAQGEGAVGRAFTCPYHSWSYSPTGELRAVMQEAKFGSIDLCRNGLVELPCEERYGLIFVVLDPNTNLELDTFLGDFAPYLQTAALDRFTFRHGRPLPHRANWKIALCGYLESYHVKTVHTNTVGPFVIGNISTHDACGPDGQHIVTTWAMNEVADLAEVPDIEAALEGLEATPFLTVLYLWPNTIITAPEFIPISHLVRVTPGKRPEEQFTDFRVLVPQQMTEDEQTVIDLFDQATIIALEQEDYGLLEDIQKGLDSGLRPGIHIGANEPSLTEMHRSFARALGRPDPDRAAP